MNKLREEAASLIDGVLQEAGNITGIDTVLFPREHRMPFMKNRAHTRERSLQL